jgi:peptidoglycan/xylan/chitin deacetylase (PgdA/CDA1 family)
MLDLHARGFEIADHTRTHPSLKGLRAAELRGEVLGAQEDLVACGVPEEDVVGLRAPFLESDAALRALLAGNGFLYDRCAGSATQRCKLGANILEGVGGWGFDGKRIQVCMCESGATDALR